MSKAPLWPAIVSGAAAAAVLLPVVNSPGPNVFFLAPATARQYQMHHWLWLIPLLAVAWILSLLILRWLAARALTVAVLVGLAAAVAGFAWAFFTTPDAAISPDAIIEVAATSHRAAVIREPGPKERFEELLWISSVSALTAGLFACLTWSCVAMMRRRAENRG